jgi:hypothetical protein
MEIEFFFPPFFFVWNDHASYCVLYLLSYDVTFHFLFAGSAPKQTFKHIPKVIFTVVALFVKKFVKNSSIISRICEIGLVKPTCKSVLV